MVNSYNGVNIAIKNAKRRMADFEKREGNHPNIIQVQQCIN